MNTLPENFFVRPPTMADLEAVVELMNAATLADIGLVNFSLESVGRYWQGGDLNLETDARLIFAPNGQLAGFAQFMEEPPPTPYDVDTWVRPDFVTQGVGEALLDWIDERAQQALTRAPAGVPIKIAHIFVYAQNRSARERLEAFGYQNARTFQRMRIDMTAPPPKPILPDGILIRTLRRGQEERALYEAFEEAQADEWGHECMPYDQWLYYFIECESNFDPTLWFLACEGEEIVGYALCRWDRPGEPDGSTVRYLAVRRAWRRRGIALALLHHTFGEIYRRGKRKVGLGVDATSYTGAERLYARAGMVVFQTTLHYEKVIRNT